MPFYTENYNYKWIRYFFLLCIPLLRTENDFVLVLVLYFFNLFRYSDGALKVLPGYFSLYHIIRENSFK